MLGFSLPVCVLWCEDWKEVWRSGGPHKHNTCLAWRKLWRKKTYICVHSTYKASKRRKKNWHTDANTLFSSFLWAKSTVWRDRNQFMSIAMCSGVLACECEKAHRPTFWLPDWMSSLHFELFFFFVLALLRCLILSSVFSFLCFYYLVLWKWEKMLILRMQ